MAPRRLIGLALTALPVLALAALLFAAFFVAGDAEGDVSRLDRWSPWLYGGALLALVVLLATLVRQLWQLAAARRARAPGARLASRWTVALVLLAMPPVLMVYGFAIKFLNGTVDSWFNVRVERALDDALQLGRLFLDAEIARARDATAREAATLAAQPRQDWQQALEAAADRGGALQVAVFSDDGALIASEASDPRLLLPTPPDSATLVRMQDGAVEARSEPLGDDLVVRVVQALPDGAVLQAIHPLPARAQALARNIEASWHDYQRLAFLRDSLKQTFTLILTAVTLLSALIATLVALRVARRQVRPVAELARATQDVAAGRYGGQIANIADDELGFLTASFNQMTRQLDDASRATRESQAETERQKHYLQTVLARLSTGVIGFDAEGRLRTANTAANAILALPLDEWLGRTPAEIGAAHPRLVPMMALVAARAREGAREWREEVRLGDDGDAMPGARVLMVRGATLPADDHAASGSVAVFDDQTVLDQIQREAAWSEVARRLAHEVKNPLTPIQLAAERLQLKLADTLDEPGRALLAKATGTIVAQVEALKALVNAFGDYARPPQLRLESLPLNALVGNVLDLYAHDARLTLRRDLDPSTPPIRADAGRLRQLLHNLIKNALEASGESPELDVTTRRVGRGVELVVADRGRGLPDGFDERWFEPDRTSKEKGNGLGLAVVRRVAEEHGGTVRAEPRDGGGARFIVTIPGGD